MIKPVAIALINSQLTLDQLTVEVDIARVKYKASITGKAAFDPDGTCMCLPPGVSV
ncbi:MAG: hypothetical protein GY770_00410 [Aestuariibacter sp.]|nr:hypothetical protein [Aestuariibacter sp.]